MVNTCLIISFITCIPWVYKDISTIQNHETIAVSSHLQRVSGHLRPPAHRRFRVYEAGNIDGSLYFLVDLISRDLQKRPSIDFQPKAIKILVYVSCNDSKFLCATLRFST